MPQLAWIADTTGEIHWFNQRWYDFTGTHLEDVEGWKWKSVHHPDDLERVVEKYKTHIDLEQEWEDTFKIRNASGDYRWFLYRAKPVKDKNG
ncbi:PAS domain-containing protein [Fulvivirga maritima]|uniref:PAS domain-containing protein n=1 Tax=Fulvivirga maritima TaxID=2904247 RepID=UPI00351EBD69